MWLSLPQNDRLTSVGNSCVIEVLVAFLCCHFAFFDFSVGLKDFAIGLRQISLFHIIA